MILFSGSNKCFYSTKDIYNKKSGLLKYDAKWTTIHPPKSLSQPHSKCPLADTNLLREAEMKVCATDDVQVLDLARYLRAVGIDGDDQGLGGVYINFFGVI